MKMMTSTTECLLLSKVMLLGPCLEQVIEVRVNGGKRGFKAKERGLSRCEGYTSTYRRKVSAKPDRALGSLKDARSSRRLSTLVTDVPDEDEPMVEEVVPSPVIVISRVS